MAEATLLHLAGSLLARLTPYVLKEIKSCWRVNDDLEKLTDRIRTIKAVLLDAENRRALSRLDEELRRRLSNVLYDAEDLFDDLITMKESRQILSGKVKIFEFFSKSNPVFLPVRVAGKIKKIRKELDDIIKDTELFKLGRHSSDGSTISSATVYDQRETASVPADEVIGREKDASKILRRLLSHESEEEDFPDVISVVGIGGMGKTSLAQLVYNNGNVKKHFELRAWACISDIKDTKQKAKIILKALQTRESRNGFFESSLEELRLEIEEKIVDKKYLLVLDDLWDDDHRRWMDLRALLKGGKRGSKIVVTTRSLKVARVMGVDPHELGGLEDDKAEKLFERWAFMSAASGVDRDMLMEMGREIVRKCKNVPLAIKAVASLLNCYGGDETKWKSIMNSDLVTIDHDENLDIMPILRLSYDHLPSHLKPCFAFCSVFPKDFQIRHNDLVACWIAHGYIEHCSGRGQTELYEKGSHYVQELVLRSFLQSLFSNRYLMHDLMHDLAHDVAGQETLVVNKDNFANICDNSNLKIWDRRIRHLSFHGALIDDDSLPIDDGKYLRSYICSDYDFENPRLPKSATWWSFIYIRVLVMRDMGLTQLPSSVCGLKHLKSLVISGNKFTHLPSEITGLHGLKVLDVSWCDRLESLPDNFNRLINLMWLKLKECSALRSMPSKFGELSSLERLDCFIAGETSGLEAIAGLVNLRGSLCVKYRDNSGGGGVKRWDLSPLVHLDCLEFHWPGDVSGWEREEVEFECSQLPRSLKTLEMRRFPGWNLPQWDESFNNLLHVHLFGFKGCRFPPKFGQHARLTELLLGECNELEYIGVEEGDEFAAETHFPCLKILKLVYLPKLKAWSPRMEKFGLQLLHISASSIAAAFPRFRSLHQLLIYECPELMSMPLPPKCISHLDVNTWKLKQPLSKLLMHEKESMGSRGETSGMWSLYL